MPKRMLIFLGTPGSGYEELSWLLHINSSALEKVGWKYFAEDYSWSTAYPRVPSAARMLAIFEYVARGNGQYRKEMYEYLRKTNSILEHGNNVILWGGFINIPALHKLLISRKGFYELSEIFIEVAVLFGHADKIIDSLYRQYMFRSIENPLRYAKYISEYFEFLDQNKILDDLNSLQVDTAHILYNNGSDPYLLDCEQKKRICELLNIGQFDNSAEKLMPKSIAGFEILYALRNIQIHTKNWPEQMFSAIRKMEENLGLLWQPLCQASGDKFEALECVTINPQIAEEFVRQLDYSEKKNVLRHLSREQQIPADTKKTLLEAISLNTPEFLFTATKSKISVLTLTHNHVNYIAQNIESVIAQKTDVTLEHIIVDDASDDGTQAVIERYASRYPHIRPIYLRERACRGENVRELFAACNSEYAALCDGDDYFSDVNKLHKQMEFMDQYKECALCFHRVDVLYEDGSPSRSYPPEEMLPRGLRQFYYIQDLLQGNFIQTNSVMYRWRFREGLPEWFDPTLIPGDWYWHLLHAETGLIGYMRDHMAVYRRHATSMYASADANHVPHRKLWGISELRTYAELDNHFKGKYHADLQKLANGVFADFLTDYLNSGDDYLLQQGCQTFPMFGIDFLSELKIINGRK